MKSILTITALAFLLAYQPNEPNDNPRSEFLAHIHSLCGSSFAGEVVHPETPPRGFTDPLSIHFIHCEGDIAHVPFHVGENKSRTWMFTHSDDGLLLKHDHRNPDGTPDGLTDYGGWATDEGTALKQYFPADEETIAMRGNLRSHIWVVELSEDLTTYSYSLYLYENLYFRADFDLTNPIESP